MAGGRHPELAAHLADWHREFAGLSAGEDTAADASNSASPSPATVKVFFLLLLGLCHVEDLESLDADPSALQDRVDRLIDALYGAGATTRG